VRPLEEALEQMKSQEQRLVDAEGYLDIEALALCIHKSPDMICHWVYKRNKNGIPAIKMPRAF
jgi:hypothetical protein